MSEVRDCLMTFSWTLWYSGAGHYTRVPTFLHGNSYRAPQTSYSDVIFFKEKTIYLCYCDWRFGGVESKRLVVEEPPFTIALWNLVRELSKIESFVVKKYRCIFFLLVSSLKCFHDWHPQCSPF